MIRTDVVTERAVKHWQRLFVERTDVDLASMVVLQTVLDDHELTDAGLGRVARAVLAEREQALTVRVARHRGETVAVEQ